MKHKHTREEFIGDLLKLSKIIGKTPTIKDYAAWEDSIGGATTVRTCFGSWNKALEAAGLTPTHICDYSKSDLDRPKSRMCSYDTAKFYRDNPEKNKCECCGETDPVVLDLHHIKPYHSFPETSTFNEVHSPENIAVLCCLCHRRVHAGQIKLETNK